MTELPDVSSYQIKLNDFSVHLYIDGVGKVSLDLWINMIDSECPPPRIESLGGGLPHRYNPAALHPAHSVASLYNLYTHLPHLINQKLLRKTPWTMKAPWTVKGPCMKTECN